MAEPKRNQFQIDHLPCPRCGSALVFAPGRGRLSCSACGREEAIKQSDQKPQSFSVEQHIEANDEIPDRPIAILPFRFTREQAVEKARSWLSAEGLREDGKVTLTEAIYLPLFLFRINASASYSGQRVEYSTETTELRGLRDEQGYAQEVKETKKIPIPASGQISRHRLSIPIKAIELPNDFVASLVDGNYKQLLAFDEAYLAGFLAYRSQLGLSEAYNQAKEIATGMLETAARDQIGGNEPTIFNLKPSLSGATFQPILIPVYTGSYTFKGELRHFAINGHTGELKGHAPETFTKSLKKWLTYAGGTVVLVVVYIFWMLLNDYDFEEIIGLPVILGAMTGAFLFFLWLHERINIWLATLIYLLASVSTVWLLWLITESEFIVKGTGMLLGVLSLLVLIVVFLGRKDKSATSTTTAKKKNRQLPP